MLRTWELSAFIWAFFPLFLDMQFNTAEGSLLEEKRTWLVGGWGR